MEQNCSKDSGDKAYRDFKQHVLYKQFPFSYRRPDLKKVAKPEILGDIMKANWSTEGDGDASGD